MHMRVLCVIPEAGCDRAGVREARAEFKRLYDKKVFGDARTTLEPLAELGTQSEKQIREDMPTADADIMVRVARATQTNLKLCK